VLNGCRPGLVLNAVFHDPGPVVFEHACKLGCEGIVSKRRGSRYGGRSSNWIKVKNPDAPAVRREREEQWGG
jgi:ATP-dependent DNA ligase